MLSPQQEFLSGPENLYDEGLAEGRRGPGQCRLNK